MRFFTLLVSSIFALHSGIACAQNSLGEILDQGAKKLSAEELMVLLVGATVGGTTPGGADFWSKYQPDGTHAGVLQGPRGQSGFQGTWKIDDSGKICSETRFNVSGIQPTSNCAFWFRAGDRYFRSNSDSDRNASITTRTVKR